MNKEFIPYKQALELKELGFDEPCLGYYVTVEVSNPFLVTTKISDTQGGYFTFAPLYQQAFRWFREKGLHSAIMPKITPSNTIVYYIYEGKPKKDWNNCFETYEEAELECLKKLIEIVKL
jgi:hypothetical protein